MARMSWQKTWGSIQERLIIFPRDDHNRLSLQLSNLTQVFASAKLQRCLVTNPFPLEPFPDISEEKLWCSSSIYDSDRTSDTGKSPEEVQGDSVKATTPPGNEPDSRIPTLVIAVKERSKALSKILVDDQGRDTNEQYREHIKEATDCYISTVEDILEHARRAEKSQWKDLDE
ncbi:unnamed protein product [Clonostachys rosea]|uniref:Uncharacterized protein n=1 Tax=Bionectria ochroleuca TaxID=29856 RepID=A0ABY6UV38_BIOOC|nr:unnamed protein product [Clonostachys rosea]